MHRSLFSALILAAVLTLAPSPSRAADVAFVDLVKVISESAPGKEGQKIVDDLRAQLQTELKQYADTEKDAQKVQQRQFELNRRFQQEHARISAILTQLVNTVGERWLRRNQKNYYALVPMERVLAVDPKMDVSDEILRLMNREIVDFKAGAQ